MPYVVRDVQGTIRAVFEDPVEGAEFIAADDPGLQAFMNKNVDGSGTLSSEWAESDLALARVLEDVVDLLIDKGVFMFTELPEGAQKKLMARRGRRKEFAYMESLFGDMSISGDDDPNQGGGVF